MRMFLSSAAVGAACVIGCFMALAADPPAPVTFVNHTKVSEALAKGGALVTGKDHIVSGSHRVVPGKVEVHETETDVMYVTAGEATFVTGGTMVGGTLSRPGQWLGTDITGGQTHHLVKGDVIVIPRGTPHWYKDTKGVDYFVVKIVKE